MRITAGRYKDKLLITNAKFIRSTTAKVRQAIFNILRHASFISTDFKIEGSTILDICSGAGIFAFEAISRGAIHATLIDISIHNLEIAKKNAINLGIHKECNFIKADATVTLGTFDQKFDIIYIDPPYKQAASLVPQILQNIKSCSSFSKNHIIILEVKNTLAIEIHESFTILDQRVYGATKIILLNCK